MGTGVAGAAKHMGTSVTVGGGARTGTGATGAAKRTGTGTATGGGARTGMATDAGMYTSSRGSTETSLTLAASSPRIVLGDQPVNAMGMVVGAGAGWELGRESRQQPPRLAHSGPCP